MESTALVGDGKCILYDLHDTTGPNGNSFILIKNLFLIKKPLKKKITNEFIFQ